MRQQTLFLVVGFTLAAHVFQTAGQHPGLLLEELFSRDITQELLNNEASVLAPTPDSVSANLRFARRQFLNITLDDNCKDNAIIVTDPFQNKPAKPEKSDKIKCGNRAGTQTFTTVGPSVMINFIKTNSSSNEKNLNDGFIVNITLNKCTCGKVLFEDFESSRDRCHDRSLMKLSNENVPQGECCTYQVKTRKRLFFGAVDFRNFQFPNANPCDEKNSVGISRKGDINHMKYFCGSTGKPEFWKEANTPKENLVRLSRNLLLKVCKNDPSIQFLAYIYTAGKRGVPAADAAAMSSDTSCICGRIKNAKKGKRRRRSAVKCKTKKQCRKDACSEESSCIHLVCHNTDDCIYKVCHQTKMCKAHCKNESDCLEKEECKTMPKCIPTKKPCKGRKCKRKHGKNIKRPCQKPKHCKVDACKSTNFCKKYCKTNNCVLPECRNVGNCGARIKCNKKKQCKFDKCKKAPICLSRCKGRKCSGNTKSTTSTSPPCQTLSECKHKQCRNKKFCRKHCKKACGKPECKKVGLCRRKFSKKCRSEKQCAKPKCRKTPSCKQRRRPKCKKGGKCRANDLPTTAGPCEQPNDCKKNKCKKTKFCKKHCKNACGKPECKNVGLCRRKLSKKCRGEKQCAKPKCKNAPSCQSRRRPKCKKGGKCRAKATKKPCRPRDCHKKRCKGAKSCARSKLQCSRKRDCKKKKCRNHPNCGGTTTTTAEATTTEVKPKERQGTTVLPFKKWPWIVLIQVKGGPVCQGILIGISEVLTCTKCATSKTPSDYTLIVKDYKLGTADSDEQTKTVKKIVEAAAVNCTGDMCLSLLILSSPVTFDASRNVAPVCLACISKKLTMLDETGFLIGYGFDPAITANTIQLKDSKGKIVDNSKCPNAPSGSFCVEMANKLPGHSCGTVATDFGSPLVVRLGAKGVYVHFSLRGILCSYDCNSKTGSYIEAFSTGVLSWLFENMESNYCHTPTKTGKKKP